METKLDPAVRRWMQHVASMGGHAAAKSMTRQSRIERARKGGLQKAQNARTKKI